MRRYLIARPQTQNSGERHGRTGQPGFSQQIPDGFPPNTNQDSTSIRRSLSPEQSPVGSPPNITSIIGTLPSQDLHYGFPPNTNRAATSITTGPLLARPTGSRAHELPLNRPVNNTQNTFRIGTFTPDSPRPDSRVRRNRELIEDSSRRARDLEERFMEDEERFMEELSSDPFPTPGERFMNAGIDPPGQSGLRDFTDDALNIVRAHRGRPPQIIARRMRELLGGTVEVRLGSGNYRSQRYDESMWQRLRWDLIRIQAGTATEISPDVRTWLEDRISDWWWLYRMLAGLERGLL